ncbi:hypothetical protein [Chitinibacter sp. GC72]|uniref:hypothetical protein n=1 Tax=Chitinibacter sp. GC72 TaxID=1526917 RepID=UPI0012F808DB|nr:hypothetical protein [Chitinibacter sp. GC72]
MEYFHKIESMVRKAECFGSKESKNGAKVFGLVQDPILGFKRWWHYLYPALSDFEVNELRKACNADLHQDFCDFLRISNGINLFSG